MGRLGLIRRAVAALVIGAANVAVKVLFLPFDEDDDYLAPRSELDRH